MIRRISISNYALIRELTLYPSEGFNIITGETGAGKSIILGALGLLQGKRLDSKSMPSDGEKTSVEAEIIFHDGSVHTLRREILSSGRSRALIDGNPVPLSKLNEMSANLLDIHSQHQNIQLSDSIFQLEILDKIAGNSELLAQYKKIYADYRIALQNFARTRDEIERTKDDADYLEYQLSEFSKLNLDPSDDEELEQTYKDLVENAAVTESLSQAAEVLTWNENSASALISEAITSLREVAQMSASYSNLLESLEGLYSELNSISDKVIDEVSAIGNDSKLFEDLEKRLSQINALKNKYKVDSIETLIAVRDNISNRLEAMHNSENTLRDLELIARNLKKAALAIAGELSERRKSAAESLAKELMQRARPLGMENLVIEIPVTNGKLNPNGIDSVEFLFAFNKNQTPMPVVNRASGGELSRVMLALKSITVEHQHTPTIIFDEIDTGVSGDVANRMGKLMGIIGKHIQVITITHLPQVAATGDRHFKVFKRDDEMSTQTFITELSMKERHEELALMLSGNANDEAALATAASLIRQNHNE